MIENIRSHLFRKQFYYSLFMSTTFSQKRKKESQHQDYHKFS